jgi:hypothetical protein
MVHVMKGGEEVKISKRAGSYVTLRDLIDWTSRDAVRFFLLSRKADTEFTFDVDLALQKNDDNPVFYVQYAHARICSVLAAWGGDAQRAAACRPVALDSPGPGADAALAKYPEMLTAAAQDNAPHDVTFYLRDLAAPTTAITTPSASWSTTSRCARRWRWSPPRRRCCTMAWRCCAFTYLVQAGAFRTPEDAEAQRAKLSLMGVEAKVTEREQSGRTVYRVRVGPFDNKEAADRMKERIDAGGMESTLVRVQR